MPNLDRDMAVLAIARNLHNELKPKLVTPEDVELVAAALVSELAHVLTAWPPQDRETVARGYMGDLLKELQNPETKH